MDKPATRGRPRTNRVKLHVSIDPDILAKIDAHRDRDRSHEINKVLRLGYRSGLDKTETAA